MLGAATPPTSWDIAKKNEIAWPRSSSGKISLTVRYADDAPADARKNMTHHSAVCVNALRMPWWNKNPDTARMIAETQYVNMIMRLRPTVSKRCPMSSGPSRFPAAKGKKEYAVSADL